MRMITVADAINQIRLKADMVHSKHIDDTDILNLMNNSYPKLRDRLLKAYGSDFLITTPTNITLVAGTGDYDLDALIPTFYKPAGFDILVSGTGTNDSDWKEMKKFMFNERNTLTSWSGNYAKYRLRGNMLWIKPTPTSSGTVRVWFVPRTPTLAAGSSFDGYDGWEEFLYLDVAITMLNIEESDPSVLMAERKKFEDDLESAVSNRDIGAPEKVQDVRDWDDDDPFTHSRNIF
jgi:hypothetical protein